MPQEKTPADFDVVLAEEANRHKLVKHTLSQAVRAELLARVAQDIVERIKKGEVAPPEPPKAGAFGRGSQ
jgi:hypothetical protein